MATNSNHIDVANEPAGVHGLAAERRTPTGSFGVVETLDLELPRARRICHYTAFQRHDPMRQSRTDEAIGGGANRVQGLMIERWSDAIEGGLYAILQVAEDDWLVLLPIAGPEAMAWLAPAEHGGVQLRVGTLGTEPTDAEIPTLAWARRGNLYEACVEAWRLALDALDRPARLRDDKPYPPIFEYLGWCSWEQYKRDIDEQTIVDAMHAIHQGDLPIRFILIDDGHLCSTDGPPMQCSLTSLGPNEKFPRGWKPIMDERREESIKWIGLWQNFNGYWNRIARDNQLGERLNGLLMDVPPGGRLPKATLPDAVGWYEAMVGYAQRSGFDFIKVDHQAANLLGYQGSANAVRAATHCKQALDRAAAARTNGLINCMAHGPVCAFNAPLGPITRCSEDYKVNDAWRAKAHLHNSYQNMLWLGPTVWGDHDMFHSNDTFAGRMMAVSKAVSGGPIYLSDDPEKFSSEWVRPLCNDQGKIYRPLAPAVPLPRSAVIDPFDGDEAYLAAAPLADGAAAVVAYNLTEPTRSVDARVSFDDYADCAGLLDRNRFEWNEPAEGLVVYDWYRREIISLEGACEWLLNGFEDRLLLLCPVRSGWAVIGRTDKYLSPTAVRTVYVDRQRIIVDSSEPCTVTIWRDGATREVAMNAGVLEINA